MRVNMNASTPKMPQKELPSDSRTLSDPSPRNNFPTRPLALPSSIVTAPGAQYRFTVLSAGLIRFEWAEDGVFEDRASILAINRDFPTSSFRVIDRGSLGLEIVTDRLRLSYDKKKFSPGGLSAQIYKDVKLDRWRYGLHRGENIGGTSRTLDEVDGRMELEMGIMSRSGHVDLDDSASMLFDGEGWVAQRKQGLRSDGYLFGHGRDYRAAIEDFYKLSGHTPLLPRWALGNWWSRYYPYGDEEYLELMDRFKKEEVPLSVAVLDMDWHLVREKVVKEAGSSGWTGYTWSPKFFPDPKMFISQIHDRNLKITVNDHPADGIFHYEAIYKEMAKALNHDTTHNDPIDFNIISPAFCNAYYDILHRSIEASGIDFWWMDWQQGTDSLIPNVDPLWLLNHFGYLDNARDSRRPIHFSRYGGPGSHRYPIGFSGDAIVTWASLNFQPEFTNSASNIGYGWWSHDIGGHMHGTADEELQTRWVQYGVFSPIMRLHSSPNPFLRKEPWNAGIEAEAVQKKFLQLRHRLLPYLYSMNVLASKGEPICQPVYWHYPQREEAYTTRNQYFFGRQLLVFPITSPADAHSRQGITRGWLPPGRYVDIFTEIVYSGDRFVHFSRALAQYPVLAPCGAIIPLDGKEVPENGCPVPSHYELLVVVGADGEFVIYEDDGRDVRVMRKREIKVVFEQERGVLKIGRTEVVEGLPEDVSWTVRFLACAPPEIVIATYNNTTHHLDTLPAGHGFKVHISGVSVLHDIEIVIGAPPRLTDAAVKEVLFETLAAARLGYDLKKEIWAILDKEMELVEKVARLSGLEIEKGVMDALGEVLMAESP